MEKKKLEILVVEDETTGGLRLVSSLLYNYCKEDKNSQIYADKLAKLTDEVKGTGTNVFHETGVKENEAIEILKNPYCKNLQFERKKTYSTIDFLEVENPDMRIDWIANFEQAEKYLNNEKYDGVICDFFIKYDNKNKENIVKRIIEKKSTARIEELIKELSEDCQKYEFGDDIKHRLKKLIDMNLMDFYSIPVGVMIGYLAKEKKIPLMHYTGELFHGIEGIGLAVYVGTINPNEVAKGINSLGRYYWTERRKYLEPGTKLASNLVMGFKDYRGPADLVVRELLNKINRK